MKYQREQTWHRPILIVGLAILCLASAPRIALAIPDNNDKTRSRADKALLVDFWNEGTSQENIARFSAKR